MATAHQPPGVYVEESPKFPPSVVPVDTAIPAFIGYTRTDTDQLANDLRLNPKRITSLAEYERYFGGPQPETNINVAIAETQNVAGNTLTINAIATLSETARSKHILYYALYLFFANGGGPCNIVSAGLYKPLGTALVQTELKAGLDTLLNVDEPTLLVFPEAQFLLIADFKALHDAALAQCQLLKDRFVIMDVHGDDLSLSTADTDLPTAIANFRAEGIGTDNLQYGAAYAPNLETRLDYAIDETAINVRYQLNGVSAAPVKLNSLATTQRRRYELAKIAIRDLPCIMPPSSSVAGIYIQVDNSRGVWKAPAGVPVAAVTKPTIPIADAGQNGMNVDPATGKSVNAIRSFTGKGTLVWGARTLAGNDNEWRYVPVRRLAIFVEESIRRATEPFVFEPNDANTWVKIQALIENFLTILWRQGALSGVKPEHAFYVAVGLGKTMTVLDVLEGRLIVEIGIAAVRPAEFVVLKFAHKMAQS